MSTPASAKTDWQGTDRDAYDPKNEFRAKLVDAIQTYTGGQYEFGQTAQFVDNFLTQHGQGVIKI